MNKREISNLVKQNIPEILILLTIPVLLSFLYFVAPRPLQELLTLNHTQPRWYSFWTSAFIHEHKPGDKHLAYNIVVYLLLIFPTLALYKLRGESKRFWGAFVMILILGPLISNVSSYLAFHEILGVRILNDRGFSGVIGAFTGFLLVSLLDSFSREQTEPIALLSMLLYASYLILGLGVATNRTILLIGGALGFIGTVIAGKTTRIGILPDLSNWCSENRQWCGVFFVAVIASAIAFVASFPSDITSGDGITNIISHGAGIIFGMVVGWSATEWV